MEHFTPGQIKFARLRMRGLLCMKGLDRESAKKWAGIVIRAKIAGLTATDFEKMLAGL